MLEMEGKETVASVVALEIEKKISVEKTHP
jgi:hypothetical protein